MVTAYVDSPLEYWIYMFRMPEYMSVEFSVLFRDGYYIE